MGDVGQGRLVCATSRQRVAIGVALAVVAAAVVWSWPRLRKAARQVEWMCRHIQVRTRPPVRRRNKPGEMGIVLSSIRVASDISLEDRSLRSVSVVPARSRMLHIFFDYSGARKGDTLTTDWFLDGEYQHVTTVPVELPPGEGHGHLQMELAEGVTLPAGDYRVDLIVDDTVAGSVKFTVERAQRPRREG